MSYATGGSLLIMSDHSTALAILKLLYPLERKHLRDGFNSKYHHSFGMLQRRYNDDGILFYQACRNIDCGHIIKKQVNY